jgi:hypothetical protein
MKHAEVHAPPLQTVPRPQLVPAGSALHADVLTPGWQLPQAFVGLTAPDGYVFPSMLHCAPHCPPAQTWPLPQLVPSVALVHVVTLALG